MNVENWFVCATGNAYQRYVLRHRHHRTMVHNVTWRKYVEFSVQQATWTEGSFLVLCMVAD